MNLLPADYYPNSARAYDQVIMWESLEPAEATSRWYKRVQKKFEFAPVPKNSCGVRRMLDLLQRWHDGMVERGKEVVGMGHYECVIKTYPDIKSAQMFACANESGEYRAMIGGYVADGKAVVVNGKHDYSDSMLAQGMYAHWLDWVHAQKVDVCHSGDTSDKLKGSLGMESRVLVARGAYERVP